MASRFKPTANNVHTMFSTTILSSVICPVGGGELGQRIGHNQLEGINRASEIVVRSPVGAICRTGGTEWAGPVSGNIE